MAVLTFTISDASLPRVVDAFATAYGYKAFVAAPIPIDPPVANPETRDQFMRRQIINFISNTIQSVESNAAAEAARVAEIAKPMVNVT